jgi:hypothetical protein
MEERDYPIGLMRVPVTPQATSRRREPHVMGWFMLISSLFWPRVFILAFWIFGSTLSNAFSSWAIPVLGFFVAPWTTVGYAFMWSITSDSVNGWEWIVVAVCALLDLVTWTGGARLVRR